MSCILNAPEALIETPQGSQSNDSGIAARVESPCHPGISGHPDQPGLWPNRWIHIGGNDAHPLVAAYRLAFSLDAASVIRIHLTGDERYEFFVDGQSIALGPERGDGEHWFFESYDLCLPAGPHLFVARVWSLGEKAPFAQMSLRHGFFLSADEKDFQVLLGTGSAAWEAKMLRGYGWNEPGICTRGTGWNQSLNGAAFDWGHESGQGLGWQIAGCGAFGDSAEGVRSVALQETTSPHHRLLPAMLPAMMNEPRRGGVVRHVSPFTTRPAGLRPLREADAIPEEFEPWQQLLQEKVSIQIPAYSRRRVLIDLDNYFCARPVLITSGGHGASIEVGWSEALYESIDPPAGVTNLEGHIWPKGHRDKIEGKFFICPWSRQDTTGDIFLLDGGLHRTYTTLWWQAGRYIQILVETKEEELEIEDFHLKETRYPLEVTAEFQCSDARLDTMIPIMVRGLEMCSHETYIDCPYYEQLMYSGDMRLEILTTYVLTADDRLPRKALKLFDWSRMFSGLTQSRYPASVRQIIPPFSLWWVAACHDYALWRGDATFTKSLLPGVRAVCDHFAALINEDGLLTSPSGWNFTDWTKTWAGGVPPDAETGISGILNWQAALVFRMAGELEKWFGEPEISALQSRRARTIAVATHRFFWNEGRGLYADDLEHRHWSEHAQCMAILSDMAPQPATTRLEETLFAATDLAQTTIYFSHYLFETYQKFGRIDAFLKRLESWHSLQVNGLKTPIESPEPNRSDCHAWGAHPLYHYYTTLAGIRPVAPGFTEVEIVPQLGPLRWLDASLPHPRGTIRLHVEPGKVIIDLPDGVTRRRRRRRGFL